MFRLLEITSPSRLRLGPQLQVNLLHGTVKDFLRTGVISNMREKAKAHDGCGKPFSVSRAIAGAFLIQAKTMQDHTYEYPLKNYYVRELCNHARKHELETGETPVELLDSLDNTGAYFYKANRYLRHGNHWTFLLDYDSDLIIPPETCDTFMTYALKRNLTIYLHDEFLQAPVTVLQKPDVRYSTMCFDHMGEARTRSCQCLSTST